MQLDLFQGEHVPLWRCHAALDRGDLREARAALAELTARAPEPSLSERLAALETRLAHSLADSANAASAVHEAFEAALEGAQGGIAAPAGGGLGAPAGGGLGPRDWFRLYAAHVAEALAPTPEASFRGWRGLHFELAAGRPERAWRAALRLTAACRGRGAEAAAHPGERAAAWLEAARVAHAAGQPERARELVLVACLAAEDALAPDPPTLLPVPHPALNEPVPLLPRLPVELEELWTEAAWLEVAAPASAWVPALGVLAGLFPPAWLRSAEVREASGFDVEASEPPGEPAARGFLRALLAAREARAREGASRAGACGEAELRARARMRALAPELLARYLEGVAGGLLPGS